MIEAEDAAKRAPGRDAGLQKLVHAARLAPSGDNRQPWKFQVDGLEGRIAVRLDASRDVSSMNAGQRMSRIAVGAAVENILHAAHKNGLQAECRQVGQDEVAVVVGGLGERAIEIPRVLRARCTNRKVYRTETLPDSVWEQLADRTPPQDGVRAVWIAERERIERLAALVGRTDRHLFGARAFRLAFLENVRFDRPAEEPVEEGLSLASLELKGADRFALRALRTLPEWVATCAGVAGTIGRQSQRLVHSASGLCLGVAADDDPVTDYAVGRAMQRAWLAITDQMLAAQPMMSLCVLDAATGCHATDVVASVPRREIVQQLVESLRTICPEMGNERPAFLLRFGVAAAPSGVCGRLGIDRQPLAQHAALWETT